MSHIVTIFDNQVEVYSNPTVSTNMIATKRSVIDLLNEDNVYAKHPEHFSLFILGTWDEVSGALKPYDAPVLAFNFWDLK